MSGLSLLTLAMSQKYTDNSVSGVDGVNAGAPCSIINIEKKDGKNILTFQWEQWKDTETKEETVTRTSKIEIQDGINGIGIKDIKVNEENAGVVVITLDDDRSFSIPIATGYVPIREI